MPSQTHIIENATGFHARPACLFAETARRFPCVIRVRKGEKVVNGKSVLAMLTLGAKHLDSVTIEAEGEGAADALDALGVILTKVFVE